MPIGAAAAEEEAFAVASRSFDQSAGSARLFSKFVGLWCPGWLLMVSNSLYRGSAEPRECWVPGRTSPAAGIGAFSISEGAGGLGGGGGAASVQILHCKYSRVGILRRAAPSCSQCTSRRACLATNGTWDSRNDRGVIFCAGVDGFTD